MRPLTAATVGIAAVVFACSRAGAPEADVQVECSIAPTPPVVGVATVDLIVTSADGSPVERAHVRAEGNMNHAGMVPSIASADEVSPGRYRASLEFTMAGDWFLLVEIALADGRRVERTISVPSVRGR